MFRDIFRHSGLVVRRSRQFRRRQGLRDLQYRGAGMMNQATR